MDGSKGSPNDTTASAAAAAAYVREGSKLASRGAPPLSPPSPATSRGSGRSSGGGGRQNCTPGSAAGRGRSERRMSPTSRTAPNDIWQGDDSESMGGRDRSVSDCGSERGSDDLRGMAFLPWSPMDGPSPRAPSWDSPRRSNACSAFSAACGSAASTPASSRRGGARDGSRVSGSSPRHGGGVGGGVIGCGDGMGALQAPQLADAPTVSSGSERI